MAQLPAARRFTVQEYYRMAEAGILGEDDRVELIEGEIVQMSPIGSRHAACVDRLMVLFVGGLSSTVHVRVQNPVRLNDRSEPEPDLALLRPRADGYATGHPGPDDVLLIIEVADTSAGYDRSVKARLYAAAGIGEMWLVDLDRDHLEVRCDPAADGYRTVRTYRRGERLTPAALPRLQLAVEEILG